MSERLGMSLLGQWAVAPVGRLLDLLVLRSAVRILLGCLGVTFEEQHANLRRLGIA
jgi:hypothetical protein